MTTSRLDAVYRSILITKFFTKGWGKSENLRRLFEFRKTVSNRDECFKLVERDYPVTITKEETMGDCRLVEGHFLTPLERFLPGIVPPAAQKAYFQAFIPLRWPQPDYRPMCLHLAGTGDHHFWRRRQLMTKPLLKEACIGGIILENPFYGLRKPSDQVRSSLHNVSDIFVMGGCLILESLVLFHWCERNNLGPLGVTGLSMGGHMASLAATNWPKPLVLVPCLSWSTASAVFLQGVMSHSINWDLLEDQYLSDGAYREKLSKMVTVVDAAFLAGKKFAQKVSRSVYGTHNETEDVTQEKVKTDDTSQGKFKTNDTTQGIVNTDDTTEGKVKTDDTTQGKVYTSTNNDTNEESLEHRDSKKEVEQRVKEDNGECSVKNGQTDLERIKKELLNLSISGQISESLYAKLSSNEKFELDSRDVEELNKLNREKILSHLASKYSVGSIRNNKSYSTISKKLSEEADDRNAQNHVEVQSTLNFHSDKTNNNMATKLESIVEKNNMKNADSRTAKIELDTSKVDRNASKPNVDITKDASNPDVVDSSKLNTTAAKLASEEAKSETTKLKENKIANKTEKKSRNITEVTQDIFANLPFVNKPGGKKIDISKIHWRDREALQFMRGIMDECTHLSNFSVPFDTSLIIAVCAKHDAYVPREDVGALEEIWPGAEVRYVDAGHVSAYLLHQSMFRSCIVEAFERSKKKWKDGKHIV